MASFKKLSAVQRINAKREYQELWMLLIAGKSYDLALQHEGGDIVAYTIEENVCGFVEEKLAREIVSRANEGWDFEVECKGVKCLFERFLANDIAVHTMIWGVSPDATEEERKELTQARVRKACMLAERAIEEDREEKLHNLPFSSSRGSAFSPGMESLKGINGHSYEEE